MKKLMVAGAAALALLAGCGVDKDKTGDNLVKNVEKAYGAALTDDQKTCLKDVVKGYSDDELTELSEQKASDDLTADFSDKVNGCLGLTDTGEVSDTTPVDDTVLES